MHVIGRTAKKDNVTNNDLQNTTQKGLSNANPTMTIVQNLLIEHGITFFYFFLF